MAIFVVLTLGAYLLMHLRPTGFMPEEDQGYLITLITLPLGASLQRTEAIADSFSKQMRDQPEVEDDLRDHRAERAHRYELLLRRDHVHHSQALGEARGAKHGATALAARANGIGARITEASVLTLNPPPIPGIGTAGGFEFILENRAGEDIQRFANDPQRLRRPGQPHDRAHARVHAVQYTLAADRVRTRPRARQSAGRIVIEHLQYACRHSSAAPTSTTSICSAAPTG